MKINPYRLTFKIGIFVYLLGFFITSQSCQHSTAEQKEFISRDVQVPNHPRLLFNATEEEQLKKIAKTDSTWKTIHNRIIEESNDILGLTPVEYELDGSRLLEQSRKCRKRVLYLSYSWRMTHEKKYLERAEKELMAAADFKDWNPSHFLDVAEMTMALAIGYDWLFSDLPKTSLTAIKLALQKKGLEPSLDSKNNWWLTESTNWNQVCNTGMTYGALAIYEDQPELARKVINRAIQSISLPMKEYDPDGAYPEGYEYWRYGTTYNVYFIDALEKNFGSSFGLMNNSGFSITANYLANMVGPTGLNFNYSDCSSTGWLNPAMFWFANRQKSNSVLYSEKVISLDKEKISGVRDLPAVIIWGAGLDFKNVQAPDKLIWSGGGKNPVALMRSSWNSNAIYVGLKGGSPSNTHGHMDAGSFVMDALGERWAMDFGAQDYGALESRGMHIWDLDQQSDRWKVFRYSNLAHNTLSFNDELQDAKSHSAIKNITTDQKFLSAIIDLTKTYHNNVSIAERGAAIVESEYVVIKDEIELSEQTSIKWRMVTPALVKIIDSKTAELSQNNKKVILKVLQPEDVNLEAWSTDPPHDYDESNPNSMFVGFEIKRNAKTRVSLTVLLIPQGAKKSELKNVPSLGEWKNQK